MNFRTAFSISLRSRFCDPFSCSAISSLLEFAFSSFISRSNLVHSSSGTVILGKVVYGQYSRIGNIISIR